MHLIFVENVSQTYAKATEFIAKNFETSYLYGQMYAKRSSGDTFSDRSQKITLEIT